MHAACLTRRPNNHLLLRQACNSVQGRMHLISYESPNESPNRGQLIHSRYRSPSMPSSLALIRKATLAEWYLAAWSVPTINQ